MATDTELYERYPFNYDNYLKFLSLWVQLDGGQTGTVEELDLEFAYNHDNYLKIVSAANAAGAEPPQAIEERIEANWVVDVPITPIDFSTNFTGVVVGYSMTFVPTGLSFDTVTGILSGTPTSISGGSPGVIAEGREINASCILDFSVSPA